MPRKPSSARTSDIGRIMESFNARKTRLPSTVKGLFRRYLASEHRIDGYIFGTLTRQISETRHHFVTEDGIHISVVDAMFLDRR